MSTANSSRALATVTWLVKRIRTLAMKPWVQLITRWFEGTDQAVEEKTAFWPCLQELKRLKRPRQENPGCCMSSIFAKSTMSAKLSQCGKIHCKTKYLKSWKLQYQSPKMGAQMAAITHHSRTFRKTRCNIHLIFCFDMVWFVPWSWTRKAQLEILFLWGNNVSQVQLKRKNTSWDSNQYPNHSALTSHMLERLQHSRSDRLGLNLRVGLAPSKGHIRICRC